MKKAILYTRVSSKEQVDEGGSLESQKRRGFAYAEKHKFDILLHFEERGESAKTTMRTQLQKMIKYAITHKGEIDVLIIYKVDRLSRNTADYLALKELFNKLGIVIVSMTENFDDNPMGRAMETVSSAFAQLDNEMRAERSKGGMEDGVRQGRWQWKAPIGYINSRVEGRKNIAPDPRADFVDALASSWLLIDSGCTMTEARKLVNMRLQELGYQEIPLQTFSGMISKKIYKGVVTGFGLEVQSRSIVPLVDSVLFDRVQNILAGNKNSGKVYNKINPDFPLRGVLIDKCGHRLTGSKSRGNGGYYAKYHCPKCVGQGISYDVDSVNTNFIEYTKAISLSNDIKEALREAIILNLGEVRAQNENSAKRINKRLLVIKTEKKEIILKSIKGVISDATAQELLIDYEAEEVNLKLEVSKLSSNLEDADEILEFGMSKLGNLAETFESIEDITIRARFQKWLFPAGVVYDGEKFGTTRLPLIYRVKQNTLAGALVDNSALVILWRIELQLPG